MTLFSQITEKPLSVEIGSRKRQMGAEGKVEKHVEVEPGTRREGGRACLSQDLDLGLEPRRTSFPHAGLQVTFGLQVAGTM